MGIVYSSDLPVYGRYDVVVMGAGPGGIGAAIAAARNGASVILIEKYSGAGGVAVNSSVPLLMGYHTIFEDGKRQIIYGIADEVARRLDAIGEAHFRHSESRITEDRPLGGRPLLLDVFSSVHAIRLVYNRMLLEAGVNLLYYTSVIDTISQDGHVEAAVVDCLEGIGLIYGKYFIDCTGDAHIITRLGAPVRQFDERESMVKTIFADVRVPYFYDHYAVKEQFEALCQKGECPLQDQYHYFGGAMNDGQDLQLNLTLRYGNALSSKELTQMDIDLREQVTTITDWLKTKFQSFAHSHIFDTSFFVGVRGGRAIVGLETIRFEGMRNGFAEEEPIMLARRIYGPPVHQYKSQLHDDNRKLPLEGAFGVPYKALLPVGFDNIACAGRAISIEGPAIDAVRLMPSCLGIGQAAGTAAALCAKTNTAFPELSYPVLREQLLQDGVMLSPDQTMSIYRPPHISR